MSMHEALEAIKRAAGAIPDWLNPREEEVPEVQAPPTTPIEDAQTLLQFASTQAQLDRVSGTWIAVQRWAAKQIIESQAKLETASGEQKTAELRSRIRACRDLLAMDEPRKDIAEDQGPYLP